MIARMPLIGVTLRGVLGRRRTWLMILLASLPVAVALIVRAGGGHPNATNILDTLLIRTVMPLLALVFGTAALGSELEDGTAVSVWAASSTAGTGVVLRPLLEGMSV